MRSRQSAVAAAVLFALAIAGCSNNDDPPAPAPMQPAPTPAADARRHLRTDERESTRDVQSRRARGAHRRRDHRIASRRAVARHRHPAGRHACRRALRARQHRTRLHDQHRRAAPRRRSRSSLPIHRCDEARSPRSTAPTSAWTSIRWSIAARGQQHGAEPAHQRRHGRHDHRRRAEQRRRDAHRHLRDRVHEQLREPRAARRCFYIDTTTDRLLTTTDPNAGTLTEIGSLGVNADAEQRLRDHHGCRRHELRDRRAHGRRRDDALHDQPAYRARQPRRRSERSPD